MQTADTSTLPRTLVVCVATAALSLGAGGAASASSDTTVPADSEPTHTAAEHTMVDTAGGDATGNTLHITERDYEFQVEGELTAGSVSIAVENLGSEIHEIGMARLVDGHTVEEVRAALETAAGEDEDPLVGLVDEDSAIDELGGIQAPGTAYTISGTGIEAGEYVLICFIPNSEGVLHAQLGMVSGFTIAEGDADQAPAPDVTYTVGDDGVDGPDELSAGETVIEIVNDSSTNREITLFKVKEGSTLDDVGAFFESADEGPPDFAGGPIEFLAFVFDGASDRTITVDLTAGQWVLQTPDPEQPFEGDPTQDPHTTLITVS
jgi:uncharacterized cupredoxin-like copper-binding protein